MNKKKETSNVIIYVCMALLLLLIVIPPVTRVLFPRENTESSNKEGTQNKKNPIVLLTCNKTSDDGTYQIKSSTRYINNEIRSITLAYELLENSATESEENNSTPSTEEEQGESTEENGEEGTTEEVVPTPDNTSNGINDPDISVLRELSGAEIQEDDQHFNIVLNQKVKTDNSSVELLSNYFNPIDDQVNYYEGIGFTCTRVES